MKIILRALVILAVLLTWIVPQTVAATPAIGIVADAKSDICNGIGAAGGGGGCSSSGPSINGVLTFGLNMISLIAGVTAVIMIMLSGFKYITSHGDSSNIATAKSTLLYAIVGVVVVALSQLIVKFVLAKVK